jgi:hypothetical protein
MFFCTFVRSRDRTEAYDVIMSLRRSLVMCRLWKELVEDFQTVTNKISKKTYESELLAGATLGRGKNRSSTADASFDRQSHDFKLPLQTIFWSGGTNQISCFDISFDVRFFLVPQEASNASFLVTLLLKAPQTHSHCNCIVAGWFQDI